MKNSYNIFIAFGTLPSLYVQMRAVKEKNKKSYIWTRSCGYFDPSSVTSIEYYCKLEGYDSNFINGQCDEIIKKINEIKENDKKAYFNIVCDDCRVQFLIQILYMCNLSEKDYNLTLIMDGTLTEMMYRVLPADYEDVVKTKWEKLVSLVKSDIDEYKKEISVLDNYCFYVSTWKNVKLLTCHKELLKNNSISDSYKRKMHIETIDFEKKFKSLSDEEQNLFFGNEFTNDISCYFESKKKNVIITGTYHFGYDDITYTVYEQLILKALDCCDSDSVVWYKAHPLYPASSVPKFENFLHGNNIKVLPPKFPLEILLWKYDNIELGGFCSTVYALINPKKVKFFFGELFSFVKYLYDNKSFGAYVFNFDVSQKLAALISKHYYENVDLKNKYNEDLDSLNRKVDSLEKEIYELKVKFNEKNKIYNYVKKVKNKLIRKKEK